MLTTIHHKTREKYDIYIGRPTIYGNPFEIGKDGNRDEVIKKYTKYFESRIITDDKFLLEIIKLKGKRLGCWCKPWKCHGDIICEFLNNLYDS